jgi:hypothetical protein
MHLDDVEKVARSDPEINTLSRRTVDRLQHARPGALSDGEVVVVA